MSPDDKALLAVLGIVALSTLFGIVALICEALK